MHLSYDSYEEGIIYRNSVNIVAIFRKLVSFF